MNGAGTCDSTVYPFVGLGDRMRDEVAAEVSVVHREHAAAAAACAAGLRAGCAAAPEGRSWLGSIGQRGLGFVDGAQALQALNLGRIAVDDGIALASGNVTAQELLAKKRLQAEHGPGRGVPGLGSGWRWPGRAAAGMPRAGYGDDALDRMTSVMTLQGDTWVDRYHGLHRRVAKVGRDGDGVVVLRESVVWGNFAGRGRLTPLAPIMLKAGTMISDVGKRNRLIAKASINAR